jgi:O-antigen ligase
MSNFEKILWFLYAISFPLYSIEVFRIDIGVGIHIALPMVISVAIIIYYVIRIAINKYYTTKQLNNISTLLYLFLLVHIVGIFRAVNVEFAFSELAKLIINIITLIVFAKYFPREKKFQRRFFSLLILSSVVVSGYLIYQYLVVFNVAYLGSRLDEPSRAARNQLTWYYSILTPLMFSRVLVARMKYRNLIMLSSIVFAVIYAGSRGSWVSIVIGVVYIMLKGIKNRKRLIRVLIVFVAILTISLFAISFASENVTTELEAKKRFLYLVNPEEVIELNSYSVRYSLVKNSFDNFMRNPILGIGFTNTKTQFSIRAHNDYFNILSDFGLVGAGVFILLIISIYKVGKAKHETELCQTDWIRIGVNGSFLSTLVYMNFLDTYNSHLFWALSGIYLAINMVYEENLRTHNNYSNQREAR